MVPLPKLEAYVYTYGHPVVPEPVVPERSRRCRCLLQAVYLMLSLDLSAAKI